MVGYLPQRTVASPITELGFENDKPYQVRYGRRSGTERTDWTQAVDFPKIVEDRDILDDALG